VHEGAGNATPVRGVRPLHRDVAWSLSRRGGRVLCTLCTCGGRLKLDACGGGAPSRSTDDCATRWVTF
jgi:hypothetical protein